MLMLMLIPMLIVIVIVQTTVDEYRKPGLIHVFGFCKLDVKSKCESSSNVIVTTVL